MSIFLKHRLWFPGVQKMLYTSDPRIDQIGDQWGTFLPIGEKTYLETSVALLYTGLIDKFGTQIYAGDAVDIGMGIYFVRTDINFFEDVARLKKMLDDNARIEVIGNVFQNPELLP